MSESHNVYLAVQSVLADMPAIAKNSQAPANMGGYAFRSIEDVTAALKPLLAKHGVVMIPSVIERRDSERSTSGGKIMFVTDLHLRFTFYGVNGDSFDASMWGQGTDMGDKAPQKAVTSAFKSMLAVTFCVSDSESDAEQHDVPYTERPRAASADERASVRALIDAQLPAAKAAIREAWKNSRYGSLRDEVPEDKMLRHDDVQEAAAFVVEVATKHRTADTTNDATPDNAAIVAQLKPAKQMEQLIALGVDSIPTTQEDIAAKLVELLDAQTVCGRCGKLTPESPHKADDDICAC